MRLALVELVVTNGPCSVRWYQAALTLNVLLEDEPNQFWLLETSSGVQLALKQGAAANPASVLLQFEVHDLDAELARLDAVNILLAKPLKVSPEGYRRVILHDPDGYRISLFDWKPQASALT